MYVVKFAFLFILVVEHYKTFQLFVTLVLKGGGGVKKETKGIKFFIRHRYFDVVPKLAIICRYFVYFCLLITNWLLHVLKVRNYSDTSFL